jgi:hypothetical protein
MECFECRRLGAQRAAVGLCHHCSAGLCAEHAVVVERGIQAQFPINQVVTLPKRTRELLCSVCKEALAQPRTDG